MSRRFSRVTRSLASLTLGPRPVQTEPYPYDKLPAKDSLRLIFLEPGRPKDALRCRIEAHDAASAPEYEALSYVWGDPARTLPLLAEGKRLMITVALDDALRQIRLCRKRRVLWIDLLCINQEDFDERTQQVQLMHSIYSEAKRVLVWLGRDDEGRARGAIKLIDKIDAVWDDHIGSIRFPRNAELEKRGLPLRDATCWEDLQEMLRLPYFERMWVVQECRVASKLLVLWGAEQIPWSKFYHTYSWVAINACAGDSGHGSEPRSVDLNINAEILFSPANSAQPDDMDWLDLFKGTRLHKAGDCRDKVYGLLGLFGEDGPSIRPDYHKSASEVFAEIVTNMIPKMSNLRLLSFAPLAKNDQFPLWAPRWELDTNDNDPGDFFSYKPFEHYDFNATLGMLPQTRQAPSWDILALEGLMIDEIDVLTTKLMGGMLPGNPGNLVNDAWDLLQSRKPDVEKQYPEPHGLIPALVWTLTAGQILYPHYLTYRRAKTSDLLTFVAYQMNGLLQYMEDAGERQVEFAELECQRPALNLALAALEAYEADEQPETDPETSAEPLRDGTKDWIKDWIHDAHPGNDEAADLVCAAFEKTGLDSAGHVRYQSMLAIVGIWRKFFVTKQGYVGLAAHGVQPGDKICALFGGTTPYIVRPTSVPGEYLFMGECYVHGLMDGMVIHLWDEGKLTAEWFHLR